MSRYPLAVEEEVGAGVPGKREARPWEAGSAAPPVAASGAGGWGLGHTEVEDTGSSSYPGSGILSVVCCSRGRSCNDKTSL